VSDRRTRRHTAAGVGELLPGAVAENTTMILTGLMHVDSVTRMRLNLLEEFS
jgi:hypothetical protein